MTDNIFFPTAHRQDKSRRDGKPYVTIWFDEIATGETKYTHIYSSCRNKKYWDEIIGKLDRDLFIGFENLVYKDKKKGLIDADCVPTILEEHPKGTVTAAIREHKVALDQERRREEKKIKPEGLFGKLFTIED